MSTHPWFISGFTDGEGSFHVAVVRRNDLPLKWAVIPEFHVSQNQERVSVLTEIQTFFGCGSIKENHRGRLNDVSQVFVVRRRSALVKVIIPFFESYPLRSSKKQDFTVFASIVRSMESGVHRDPVGLRLLIEQAYQMNGAGKYRKIRIEMITV